MNKENIQEISIALALIVLVVMFFDPLMVLMPGTIGMLIMLLAVVLFLIFGVFVWKEQVHDEREEYHRMLASRMGWFVGAAILMTGLLVQGFRHAVDPWLIVALVGMVLGKISARLYGQMKK